MQNRIDRLENLVLSLMTNGSQNAGAAAAQAAISSARSNSIGATSGGHSIDADGESIMQENDGEDSDVNDVSSRIGIMKVDNGKAVYASDAHWYSILADVSMHALDNVGQIDTPTDRRSQKLLRKPSTTISGPAAKGPVA